jgi:hypothetical protein
MSEKQLTSNSSLLLSLISLHLPQHRCEDYFQYIQRILSSHLSSSPASNPSLILSSLKRRLPSPAHKRLEALFSSLLSSSRLKNLPAILQALSNLTGKKQGFVFGAPLLQASAPKQPALTQAPDESAVPISRTRNDIESFLIRDALFAFQGIEGKLLSYSRLDDKFSIRKDISAPLKYTTEKIAEIGWLFKRLNYFLKANEEFPSIICQSFCATIKVELKEYFRFVALLETQSDAKIRHVEMWCDEPLMRLHWLCLICDAVEGLKGGNFISAVFTYSKFGDPAVKVLVNRILDSISEPYVHMIETWMLEGELTDAYHEFFIEEKLDAQEAQLWTQKFKLIEDNVPGFFVKELVDQILLTGKSIIFLRKSCSEEWKSETPLQLPKLRDLPAMKKWVAKAAQATNIKLLGVLFDKYKFLDHARCIRNYLLLARGDFHHYLIEQLDQILNEQVKQIHKHTLVSVLENAIRTSNTQNEDLELVSRLSIRLEEFSASKSGWDAFVLKYAIDPPLNSIFTEQVMATYTKIFKLFWSIKRVYFYMNSYQNGLEVMRLQKMTDICHVLHKSQMVHLEIMHFINNLYNYLMVEVQENAWNIFLKNVENVENFDKLIDCHKDFLESIQERAFLNSDNEKVLSILKKILMSALRFRLCQETLISSALDEERVRDINLSFSRSKSEDSVSSLKFSRISKESINEIEKINQRMKEYMSVFRQLLADSEKTHFKFLSFRLDFNEFYSQKTKFI